jgi:hypothetical protein
LPGVPNSVTLFPNEVTGSPRSARVALAPSVPEHLFSSCRTEGRGQACTGDHPWLAGGDSIATVDIGGATWDLHQGSNGPGRLDTEQYDCTIE